MQDVISRKAAIRAVRDAEMYAKKFGYHRIVHAIEEVPAIDLTVPIQTTPMIDQVRDVMVSLDITQQQLADRMDMSLPAINRWLKKNRMPNVVNLEALADALGYHWELVPGTI